MHRRRWMGVGLGSGIGLMARAALPALALVGCASSRVGAAFGGATMGTRYQVHLAAAPGGREREHVQALVQGALNEVDEAMSTYRLDSELSRLNAAGAGHWVPISAPTRDVLRHALAVWQRSGGAFDVSVGPLVDLWGFGPPGTHGHVPAAQVLERAIARVGLAGVELSPDGASVRKAHAHTRLDLSGIAKGYALDRVARRLDQQGFDGYLVEVGGELRARGVRADGAAWRVAIEQPLTVQRSVQRVVELGARAIASSGDYRNFFEYEGVRYSHTIDPRSGWPVRHDLAAVSVIADDAVSADALATAILVQGAQVGFEFAQRNAIAAHLVVRNATGLREQITPAMRSHIVA